MNRLALTLFLFSYRVLRRERSNPWSSQDRGTATRIYYELFSGPGRCLIRDSDQEADASPLQVLKHDFTRFIFTEMNVALAEALRDRLVGHPKADQASNH